MTIRVPVQLLLQAALLTGCLAPGQLRAQAGAPPRVRWELGSTTLGWCVHFLLSPEEARRDLPRGYHPVPAREAGGIPPILGRVAAEGPEYADWVPSRLCVHLPTGLGVANRRHDRGDGGKPLALLWWGVAATGERLQPDSGGLALRILATNSSGLKRQMELELVRMERIDIDQGPIKESEDQRTRIRFEDSEIILDAHSRPDSTLKPETIHLRAVMAGDANMVWFFEPTFEPSAVSGLAGAIRFSGKDDLAKALARSPIRLLGSAISGGPGNIVILP